MINYIPNEKTITLTSENNQKTIYQSIVYRNYTHVFTSLKIVLSKKLKTSIQDNSYFVSYLALLDIYKIHLVEEWDKSFCLLYAKIEKVRK